MVSWFLHLTARVPLLGVVRFDLLLVMAITIIHLISGTRKSYFDTACYKSLIILIVAIIVATPFAEWPGSVLKFGIPNFIKAVVFFFFTAWYVTSEKRIKVFVLVFVVCQSFRVLEPLYLHFTEGYWGSFASMANWEYMFRLSGAPSDTINPNGLAFVVLTILPFLIALFNESKAWKVLAVTVGPASLYALYLTGSRSGMLGFVMIFLIFLYLSKRKTLIVILMAIGGVIAVSSMHDDFKDRYLSIFKSDTSNAASVEGRIDGVISDFKVGLRKPIFGHGLGTSAEANANYGGKAQISHNIYTETFQEIGIVGLTFFLMFAWMIIKTNLDLFKHRDRSGYLAALSKAIFMFSAMTAFFGLASYGLSSYEWYLLGGLSTTIHKNLRNGK
jgi:O-antigen ligase